MKPITCNKWTKIGKYHAKIYEPNVESQVHSFMWKTKVRKCASLKEEIIKNLETWGKGKDKMHMVIMDSEKTVAISQ